MSSWYLSPVRMRCMEGGLGNAIIYRFEALASVSMSTRFFAFLPNSLKTRLAALWSKRFTLVGQHSVTPSASNGSSEVGKPQKSNGRDVEGNPSCASPSETGQQQLGATPESHLPGAAHGSLHKLGTWKRAVATLQSGVTPREMVETEFREILPAKDLAGVDMVLDQVRRRAVRMGALWRQFT